MVSGMSREVVTELRERGAGDDEWIRERNRVKSDKTHQSSLSSVSWLAGYHFVSGIAAKNHPTKAPT